MGRRLFILFLALLCSYTEKLKADSSPGIEPRKIIEQTPTAPEQEQKPPTERRIFGKFEDGFELGKNPVVVLVGGSDIVKQSENAYLEFLLMRHAAKKPLQVRNLAWQADTVYQQQRPRNFGTHLEMLHRVDASIIFSSFGQMESLDGPGKLSAFLEAYRTLLGEYAKKTEKIVLITPHPFGRPESDLIPDLTEHNSSVIQYAAAIRKLADEMGYLCVDHSTFEIEGLTRDGIHLTTQGHWELAFETVNQLTGASPVSGESIGTDSSLSNPAHEKLRNSIQTKNFLWHQHWRPTNWAFAYGNRQSVPSSHDHRPDKPRWMPDEIANIISLIQSAETEIISLNTQLK